MRLVLPHALCGRCDDEFVRRSVEVRLPDILDHVVEKNGSALSETAALQISTLAKEIRNGTHEIQPLDASDGGPDWTSYCSLRVGQNAMDVDWFFLENYAYRVLMRATDYFTNKVDPFKPHKIEALESALASLQPVEQSKIELDAASFAAFVHNALWGNQVDLSFSSGKVAEGEMDRHLVLDDTAQVWDRIFGQTKDSVQSICYILDNCGAELLNDLLLLDLLLTHLPGLKCHVHAKFYPVFVSDALPEDVTFHIDALKNSEVHAAAGQRLHDAVTIGRLEVTSHEFYTSPLPFWQAPSELKTIYETVDLVVTKGDANYRRLIGDRNWPLGTPFKTAMSYWGRAKLLAIRTCKSPAAIGFSDEDLAAKHSPDWLVNGKTGLISFYSM